MTCERYPECSIDTPGAGDVLRCVNCGNVLDAVIVRHRWSTPPFLIETPSGRGDGGRVNAHTTRRPPCIT